MDLSEFVRETLTQIVAGVRASMQAIEEFGGASAPSLLQNHGNNDFEPTFVDFDVAVVVSAGTGSGGKLEVAVWGVRAGIGGKSDASEQTTSRVRFKVPIYLPAGNTHQHLIRHHEALDAETKALTGLREKQR